MSSPFFMRFSISCRACFRFCPSIASWTWLLRRRKTAALADAILRKIQPDPTGHTERRQFPASCAKHSQHSILISCYQDKRTSFGGDAICGRSRKGGKRIRGKKTLEALSVRSTVCTTWAILLSLHLWPLTIQAYIAPHTIYSTSKGLRLA